MRRVVYTGVFGETERLQELAFTPGSDIDYICLTDQENLTSNSWQVIRVAEHLTGDSALRTRYYKFLGNRILQDWDFLLWADNKVRFTSEPLALFDLLAKSNAQISLAFHDHRSTVREEINAVLRLRKDHPFRVYQMEQFLRTHAPRVLDEKPFAGTIVLRRNCDEVNAAMEELYELVLRFSRRDQLALNYIVGKHNLRFQPLNIWVSGSELHSYLTASQVARSQNSIQLNSFPSVGKVLWGLFLGSTILKAVRKSMSLGRLFGREFWRRIR